MPDTINIASKSPLPLRLMEPHPNPEKPGDSPELRSIVLGGKSHHTISGETVTRGVDAKLFRDWMDANPNHSFGNLFREVSDEEADALDDPEIMFGFEPGIDAKVDDVPVREEMVPHKEGAQLEPIPPAEEGARLTESHQPGAPTTQSSVNGMSDAELDRATRPV